MKRTFAVLTVILGVFVSKISSSGCTTDFCEHVHCDNPVACSEQETYACTECCCCLVCVPTIPKGGTCNYDILPPHAACRPGTYCDDGVCKCIMEY